MAMQIIMYLWWGWGGGGGGDKKIVIVFSKEANVEQSKGNKFYVTSYNRPWATTNHSALSFHIIV